jgi:hypothetical protein
MMFFKKYHETLAVLIIFLLAILLGTVFIFLIPPWQHYDEPNHFEYAWLIANRWKLPKADDYDQDMRRGVAMSMIEHGFFKGLDYLPDFNVQDKPIWIGPASQLTNRPVYYSLASLPLNFVKNQDYAIQLYAVRLVSLFFYLVCVLSAWGVARELAPSGHALRILLPLSVAFLPGFVDLMTAANNDAAAVCFASLFLWGGVRLLRRGFSILVFLGIVLAAMLCFFSKETAYFTLLLLPVIFVFAIIPRRFQWLAWLLMALSVLTGVFLMMKWDDTLGWYRSTSQFTSTRLKSSQAVHGEYVFQIQGAVDITPAWMPPLFQTLSPDPNWLKNQVRHYTLGGWIWADREVKGRSATLGVGQDSFEQSLTTSQEPQFFSVTVDIQPGVINPLRVFLNPLKRGVEGTVFFDGLYLVEGNYLSGTPPVFTDKTGRTGTIAGQPFTNLLQNGSAEIAGPRFITVIDDLGAKILPDNNRPSLLLASLFDQNGAGWYYNLSFRHLFRTFWARFGWGHVPLLGHKPYRYLGYINIAGLLVGFLWLIRTAWVHRKNNSYWDSALLIILSLVTVWGMTWVRGLSYLGWTRLYLPVARYAYPAVIPTMLLLVLGWERVMTWVGGKVRWLRFLPLFGFGIFFISLDIYSIISILTYYTR